LHLEYSGKYQSVDLGRAEISLIFLKVLIFSLSAHSQSVILLYGVAMAAMQAEIRDKAAPAFLAGLLADVV